MVFGKKSNAEVPATGGSLAGSTTFAWPDDQKVNCALWKAPRQIRLNYNIVVR